MKNPIGKIALVTGSSRGIGRAIALGLAQQGVEVAVHYGHADKDAQDVVDEIQRLGGKAFAIGADLSTTSGAVTLVSELAKTLQTRNGESGFDILVNNAGIGLRSPFLEIKESDVDRIFQMNFKSPFFIIQTALGYLRNNGRIINISSMSTRSAYAEMAVYASAKAALETCSISLAKSLGPRGITVNAVLPGATDTDMNQALKDASRRAATIETVALNRIGKPEDIADVVLFLAGNEGRWVTGQRIDASGGQRL